MAETVQTFNNIPEGAAWDETENAVVFQGEKINVTGVTTKDEFDDKLKEAQADAPDN